MKSIENTKNTPPFAMTKRLAGFTLVELIVVITILVILATIAFTQFGSFQGSARDSSRVSDLANISKSLDIAHIKSWSYPSPDNAFSVTFSGWALWYQGTVGNSVVNTLSAGWGAKLSKKPTDPLDVTKEYTYSKLAFWNAYQLKTDWEGDSVAFTKIPLTPFANGVVADRGISWIDQTYAATNNPTLAYIQGNYNGLAVKTQTGTLTYILAVPSIITSQTGTNQSFEVISALSNKILVNGKTNSGGIVFIPSIVFSGTFLPTNDTASGITNLVNSLKSAYSGSVIASESAIKTLLTTTESSNIVSLGSSIITNHLGGNATVPPGTNNGTNPVLTCSGTAPTGAGLIASTTAPTSTGSWTYSGSTTTTSWPACTWSCTTGYSQNGTVGCTPRVYVDDVFSAYTYTGNGGTQTINNGINLSGEGGMVWIKCRSFTYSNAIFDTTRGIRASLISNQSSPQYTALIGDNDLYAFNSNGFMVGSDYGAMTNTNTKPFASWTFRKAPKFFTQMTVNHTSGTPDTIDLSTLGQVGMVVMKRTDSTSNWYTWHRSQTSGKLTYLNLMNAETIDATLSVAGTNLTVASATPTGTYIVYAWAHDPDPTGGIIQAGSFTTDASGKASVNLGWEPQFVLAKNIAAPNGTEGWVMFDTARGTSPPESLVNGAFLYANSSATEDTSGVFWPTATGFKINTGYIAGGNTTKPFIYLAIRRPNKPPTSGLQVYNAISRTGTSLAATVTGVGFAPDMVIIKGRTANMGHDTFDRLRGPNLLLDPAGGAGEYNTSAYNILNSFNMDGITIGPDAIGVGTNSMYNWSPYINSFFKRATGFFDIVAYNGVGTSQNIVHNLGVTPELVITKSRTSSANPYWSVWHSWLLNTQYVPFDPSAKVTDTTLWNSTSPTTSLFSVGTSVLVNQNTVPYVSYLFATLPNISKVGSYTGNGGTLSINAGFDSTARFILIKRTDVTGAWYMWDSARWIVDGNDPHLSLNSSAAEVTIDDSVDPDATGFAVNQVATTNINVSGGTYIYLAIH